MVYPTVEVRWFFAEPLSDAVRSWFGDLETERPIAQSPRTDLYVLPTDPAMNVKVREGRLEVKRRDDVGEERSLAGVTSGRLETWRKWSFDLQGDGAREADQDERWIAVRKRRWLRNYQFADAPSVTLVRTGDAPEATCQVEIAEVGMRGSRWWSLCFEAYGRREQLAGVLIASLEHVLAERHPFVLSPEHAMGYPAWLLEHVTVDDGVS